MEVTRADAELFAGAAIHFAMEPGQFDAFIAWLSRESGNARDPALVRAVMARAHGILAPDCDTPIEVL